MRTQVSPEHKTVRAVCIDVKTVATRLMLSSKNLGNCVGDEHVNAAEASTVKHIAWELPRRRLTSSLMEKLFQAAAP